MVWAIEKQWSGSIGGYNVNTVVMITVDRAHDPEGNTINLWNGTGPSQVDYPNLNTGNWYFPGQWGAELYAHEAGHLLGLLDTDGTGLMVNDLNGARPDRANIEKILSSENDSIKRGCGCGN